MSYKNPKNASYINNYTSLVVPIYPLKEYMSYKNKKNVSYISNSYATTWKKGRLRKGDRSKWDWEKL